MSFETISLWKVSTGFASHACTRAYHVLFARKMVIYGAIINMRDCFCFLSTPFTGFRADAIGVAIVYRVCNRMLHMI